MTDRINNIISKEIVAIGANVDTDFISDMTWNFVNNEVERLIASYVRNCVSAYTNSEYVGNEREKDVLDVMENLTSDGMITWGEF